MKRYYTTGEAAAWLGIGIHTVIFYLKALKIDGKVKRDRKGCRKVNQDQLLLLEEYKNRDDRDIRIDDQEELTMLTSGIL